MRVGQRIYVTRRRSDGLFLHVSKSIWTEDISQAHIVSKTKFKSLVRVDLGRDLKDYEMLECFPSLEKPEK